MKITALILLALVASSAFARGHGGGGHVYVRSHVTTTGSYVQSHQRTAPNHTKVDNWSARGNVNPYTGKKGSK